MNYLKLTFVLLCLYTNLGLAQLYPAMKISPQGEMTYGYINSAGKLYAPYEYEFADEFSDSLGLVRNYDKESNLKYGYLNKFGRVEIPLKYDDGLFFKNGYALVMKNELVLIIDKKGNEINVDNIYFDKRNYVSEGLILIKSNNKYGYSNLKNELVIPPKYDYALIFSEGKSLAILDKIVYIIDSKGKETKVEYTDATLYKNGLISVRKSDGKWGVIDKELKTVIDFKYDYLSEFFEGFATFAIGEKYGLIDEKNNIVIPAEYDWIYPRNNNMVVAFTLDNNLHVFDNVFKKIKTIPNFYDGFSPKIMFKGDLCYIPVTIKDPKNKNENIRNYGGVAEIYINKMGETVFKSGTFYSCFPENSIITMADFSSKKIQDILEGDEILSYNNKTKSYDKTSVNKLEIHAGEFDLVEITVSKSLNLTASTSDNLFLKDQKISATPNHPILTKKGIKRIDEIKKNDVIFVWNESSQDFDELKVLQANKIEKTSKVYNLKTKGSNYIVNSVVVMRK